MTLTEIQRAGLTLFAAATVGPQGSLDQMKAVCHIMRNRVVAGWEDGNWLAVLGNVNVSMAAYEKSDLLIAMRLKERMLQQLAQAVDDIYFGQADDDVARVCAAQGKERGPILYWAFIDRAQVPWFTQTIVRRPQDHMQRGQVGNNMYLYE